MNRHANMIRWISLSRAVVSRFSRSQKVLLSQLQCSEALRSRKSGCCRRRVVIHNQAVAACNRFLVNRWTVCLFWNMPRPDVRPDNKVRRRAWVKVRGSDCTSLAVVVMRDGTSDTLSLLGRILIHIALLPFPAISRILSRMKDLVGISNTSSSSCKVLLFVSGTNKKTRPNARTFKTA